MHKVRGTKTFFPLYQTHGNDLYAYKKERKTLIAWELVNAVVYNLSFVKALEIYKLQIILTLNLLTK